LAATRDTCVLFDMDKLVRSLEGLYAEMAKAHQAGRTPQPDLCNLDAYLEIGVSVDHEAAEMGAVADYHGLYQDRLRARHRMRPLPADHRLWTKAEIKAAG
jgi:hypothetical protein